MGRWVGTWTFLWVITKGVGEHIIKCYEATQSTLYNCEKSPSVDFEIC